MRINPHFNVIQVFYLNNSVVKYLHGEQETIETNNVSVLNILLTRLFRVFDP